MDILFVTLELVLILLLVWISIEDYLFRAVSWISYPLLAFASTGYSLQFLDWHAWFQQVCFNFLFTTTQLVLLTIYFSIKAMKFVNVTKALIGWGDILLLVSIALLFSPTNYCLFYVASLALAVMFTGLYQLFSAGNDRGVPLAGIQATLLVILLSGGVFDPDLNLTRDDWFVKYLLAVSE